MKQFLENVQIVALIFSILAPCLLTAGYAYHLGNIFAYGLDNSLIERGFGEVIAESWFVGITFIAFFASKIWYPIYFVAFLFVFMIYGVLIVTKRRERGLANSIIDGTLSKENPGRKILGLSTWHWCCIFGEIPNLTYIAAWPVGLFAIAFFFSLKPYGDANKTAKETISQYNEYGCSASADIKLKFNCIQLIDYSKTPNELLIEGVLVSSNNEKIAIYANQNIEVWPLLDNYKITRSIKLINSSEG